MEFAATWELVLAGRKTMTRRMVQGRHAALLSPDGSPRAPTTLPDGAPVHAVLAGGRLRYAVGKTLAVQPGRGKHAVGRVRVTAIRYHARAGAISEEDARSEGFASAAAFRAVFGRLNGAASLERPCWSLRFTLADDAARGWTGCG